MTETLARIKGLLRRLLARRGAALGLGFLGLVALAAGFATVLPFDPLSQSVAASLLPPQPPAMTARDTRAVVRNSVSFFMMMMI